ncbi:MAG: ribosomal protein S18-alanine N-acetyltransferase [Halieaceae bacterium]|jgi:ribosomal-protein-alanine N-acetyltransferase|nr:ribosomal protein S18-alanine N-acetyltransferase [Halieaceae bacterium]
MAEAPRIRPGQAADLKAMADLEKRAAINPWSLSQFLESSLRDRDAALVAESGDAGLVGFAVYQRVLDEASLLNIAVEPAQQGRGLGAVLLQHLLDRLAQQGVSRLLLEVRCGNLPAIRLYRRLGFVDDGRRPDYYPVPGGREDALLMSRELERKL